MTYRRLYESDTLARPLNKQPGVDDGGNQLIEPAVKSRCSINYGTRTAFMGSLQWNENAVVLETYY